MSFLFSILPAALVIGILIIFHEFGHFLACRLSGVRVEKFSIGFGPEIFHWQGKETRYVVSLFPLGGFVKPAGETVSELEHKSPRKGEYLAAPLPKRIFIVVAGVMMNYILAFFLFFAIFMIGQPIVSSKIGGFVKNFPAEKSGLQVGDKIVQINQTPVADWLEMTKQLEVAPEGDVELIVERVTDAGQIEQLPILVAPKLEEISDHDGKKVKLKRLGIRPDFKPVGYKRFGVIPSVQQAAEEVITLTLAVHGALFQLFIGQRSINEMAGPIGIISMTGEAAQMGLQTLLLLTAHLSVSLAVINLLPIPALDGGHLLFLLIEGVRRKAVSLQVQEKATQVGFMLLLAFMVFVIYNDLINLNVFEKIRSVLNLPK